ncbi:MAG: hybrid sensor histidine kinase/response regulator, partial [Moorea sp. SIO2B7]|nr:hybrid sensor histidine kinase/response regulator [Moorena sp. SIO2B7]
SIELADRIDIRPNSTQKICIHCNHPEVPLDETNLAYKAAKLLPSDHSQLCLSTINLKSLIEPIAILPAQMSVREFSSLQAGSRGSSDDQFCALVDSDGKFLGLLDSWSLLKSLLTTSIDHREIASQKPLQASGKPQFQPVQGLPLPLILQPAKGSVDSQNLTWREQIETFILEQNSEQRLIKKEQLLSQELAAKNANLVRLNRLKDEFLATLSHELKSPLTSIMGLSSLLQEQKLGQLNQRQNLYAELIYQGGRKLMTLVKDLIDLTRLETAQLHLKLDLVEIKTVCQRAYALIEEKYKGKTDHQLQFTLEIETGLEMVVADEIHLCQMLVNLLGVAFKFTESGGKIGLKVNCWQHWIAFTVWDTGVGIPEEFQPLIFEQFQQLESPLTHKFEDTGLELILTQRLARAHGGDVSFFSKLGQGSQFTLLLPQRLTSYSSQLGKQGNRLVLIIESIPENIENLREKLLRLGYRVFIDRSGTEALEKARQLQPYAILLNPVLGLLSGWDVLTLLKSDPQTRDIPLFVTATEAQKSLSKENGANGFLRLPVESKALQDIFIFGDEQKLPNNKSLTILRLYPGEAKKEGVEAISKNSQFDLAFIRSSAFNHRILEADSLTQAEILARVWKINVIILDEIVSEDPLVYLRSLGECESLASLPLVTLDAKTTEAANQISGLSVFPCLVPFNEQNLDNLLEVIQIAAGIIINNN